MKRFVICFIAVLFSFTMLFAGYKENLTAGVKAYKSKNFAAALKYFRAAYSEKQSPKLKQYITMLEKKVEESGDDLLEDAGVDSEYAGWSTRQNVVGLNTVFIFSGVFGLRYERQVLNNLGVGLEGGYAWTGGSVSVPSGSSSASGSGFVVGGFVNWYPQQRALNAWYLGPEFYYYSYSLKYDLVTIDYYDMSETKETVNVSYTMTTFGGHGGYRWIFDNGIGIDLSLGVSMLNAGNIKMGDMSVTLSGIIPTFAALASYAF